MMKDVNNNTSTSDNDGHDGDVHDHVHDIQQSLQSLMVSATPPSASSVPSVPSTSALSHHSGTTTTTTQSTPATAQSATATTTTTTKTPPHLPISIILQHILPYLNRCTLNAVCQSSKEIHEAIFVQRNRNRCIPPWPQKWNWDIKPAPTPPDIKAVHFLCRNRYLLVVQGAKIRCFDVYDGNCWCIIDDAPKATIETVITHDDQWLAYSCTHDPGPATIHLMGFQRPLTRTYRTIDETTTFGMDMARDAQWIVSCGYRGSIHFHGGDDAAPLHTIEPTQASLCAIQFVDGDNRIVAAGDTGIIYHWQIECDDQRNIVATTLLHAWETGEDYINYLCVDGSRLWAAGTSVSCWDDEECVYVWDDDEECFCIARVGQCLAVGDAESTIMVYHPDTGASYLLRNYSEEPKALAVARGIMAVGFGDGTLHLHELQFRDGQWVVDVD